MKKQLPLIIGIVVGALTMFAVLFFKQNKAEVLVAKNTPPENAIGFVEIPIVDTARAINFYKTLFNIDLQYRRVDSLHMYFFPMNSVAYGSTLALVNGTSYTPSVQGAVVYFTVKNIDSAVKKSLALGAKLNYPITLVDSPMKVAEIIDVEGNRIGLQQP